MPDTIRTKAALIALFPDNTIGDISAQEFRDFVESAMHPMTRQTPAFAAALVINSSLGGIAEVTLTGNVTSFSISNGINGMRQTVALVQDGTGNRTFAGATGIKWQAGTPPILSPTGNTRDIFVFYNDGTQWLEESCNMDVR